jgi:gliding motility-associated-like protein
MKFGKLLVLLLIFVNHLSPVWGFASDSALDAAVCAAQATDSIKAPNVFTPNSDGENDLFEVFSTGGQTVALKVFTRAGVLVFSITAKTCQWDGCSLSGEKMADGIYFYTAEVPGSSPKVSKSGFVHLFR